MANDQVKRLDFMYEVLKYKQQYLDESYNALVVKINFMLAFGGAILVFYSGFLYTENLLQCVSYPLYILRITGVIISTGAILCLIMATRLRHFKNAPHEDTIYSDKAFEKDYYSLKNQVTLKMKEAFVLNHIQYSQIERWIGYANTLLFIAICLIIIGILT